MSRTRSDLSINIEACQPIGFSYGQACKTIDSTCRLCCLEEEDLYHMVTRCPAFHDIRISSVERLKQIVVEQSGGSVWCSTFESWDTILKVLICPDCVTPLVPGLSHLTTLKRCQELFSTKYISKD